VSLTVEIRQTLEAVGLDLGAVLGSDIRDAVKSRAGDRAAHLAKLLRGSDAGEAAKTARGLMRVRWGASEPDAEWWRTDLGLACARVLGDAVDGEWTHQHAADVLGVTRGTVGQLVTRGTLTRGSGGGVLRSAVLTRVVRLREAQSA
jgi:hypothetical protein